MVQRRLLIIDDDIDDQELFTEAIGELNGDFSCDCASNGEEGLDRLNDTSLPLPHLIFLDLNMPMKNGSECLSFIKKNEKLKKLPVIIYSTSLHVEIADLLYKNGAHYYIRKTELPDLKKVLSKVLPLIMAKNLNRPTREEFVLSLQEI